ncbi:MAG TPA: class I SAM-dependent methyltransferase, partial [Candidatus Limnocylindrales bacterium]
WDEPDRQVDALFTGFWLSHVTRERLTDFLGLARRWLRPGGTFAFIDSLPDPMSGAADQGAWAAPEIAIRRLADGREFRIPKIHYRPAELERAILESGFERADVGTSGRFFILGSARA